MTNRPRVLLLGAGRMGGALLEGWLTRHALAAPPVVLEPTPTTGLRARAKAGEIRLNPEPGANTPEIAVIAVKPQNFTAAFTTLTPYLGPNTALLSVAAGRTVEVIGKLLAAPHVVVRAMPNTPASIGRGMTVAYGATDLEPGLKAQCTALLETVGEVAWISDESQMDAVTAVSGSGPAYVFYLVECLAAAGVAEGLPPELALKLARATLTGAAALIEQRPDAPATLRAEVTSPSGTTEAALKILMSDSGLAPLLREAVAAARARGRSLAETA